MEAIAVADEFLGRPQSRGGEAPAVLPILNEVKSRSESALPDTLAFVVNYPDKSGFAVVMNADRPDRVLAFSDTGNFSLDNEVTNEYFVSRIGSFMSASPNGSGGLVDFGPTLWGAVPPFVVTPIYENEAPYYNYIRQNISWAYAGTGPVALAKVMLHAKDKVENCYGSTLYCKSIRNAYTGTASESPDPTYTLSYAKNQVSLLLYNLGSQLGIKHNLYRRNVYSTVDPFTAVDCLLSFGFDVTEDVSLYNFADVYNAIGNGNIVVMTGKRELVEEYSDIWATDYWVCDGRYKKMIDISQFLDFIHCSWGNSAMGEGDNNGYYLGTCFEFGENPMDCYFPLEYFAVKLEVKL